MNICNISHADIATCFTNVCQSVSDHTGTDGLNWFSAIGPDLSGVPCGLSMLRQAYKVLRGCPVTQRDGGFCVSLFGKAVKCKVALLYYKIEDLAWRLMAAKTEYDF